MKKFGDAIHHFGDTSHTLGYAHNLYGRSSEEIRSDYTQRAEDGKMFYQAQPAMKHYSAWVNEEYAPEDGVHSDYYEKAQAVRQISTKNQMQDLYRRGEARRGGGPNDYVQICEDQVSYEEEQEMLSYFHQRRPNPVDIDRRQAIRQSGKNEAWNQFDFENEHNGGLAKQNRDLERAKKHAEIVQNKKRMAKIQTDAGWNAQDYFSRSVNMNLPTERGTDNVYWDGSMDAWNVNYMARPNFGFKFDSLKTELFQNLKTHNLLNAEGTAFVPTKAVKVIADNGATQAELTQLVELFENIYGKANINRACSMDILLEFLDKVSENYAPNGEYQKGNPAAESARDTMTIFVKISELLGAPGVFSFGKKKGDLRFCEKFSQRESFLTKALLNREISRKVYHQELYKTLSKYHGAVLKSADLHFKKSGVKHPKLIEILNEANKIFQLYSASVKNSGVNLTQKEVAAIQKIIALNNSLELGNGIGSLNASFKGNKGVEIRPESFYKAYAAELEDIFRFNANFDKEHPGVRVEYNRDFAKNAAIINAAVVKAAPKALRESTIALGRKLAQVLDDPRLSAITKTEIKAQVDLSAEKLRKEILSKENGLQMNTRIAHEMQALANTNAKFQKEIDLELSGATRRIKRINREDVFNKASLVNQQQQNSDVLGSRRNLQENRGEVNEGLWFQNLEASWDRGQAIPHMEAAPESSWNNIGVNGIGASRVVYKGDTEGSSNSMFSKIANAGYTPAYGSELPMEFQN